MLGMTVDYQYSITTDKAWRQAFRELGEQFERWGVDEWDVVTPPGANFDGYRDQTESSAQ
jgi:hypothetical protein